MTIEQLTSIKDEFIKAIREYRNGAGYNPISLEIVIDDALSRLPSNDVYVEWFDRSQIRDLVNSCIDDEATEDLVDLCMHNLWDCDESYMDTDSMRYTIEESVKD